MLKCFTVSRVLDKIDCIGKYFLMEKMAFLSMPYICFHEAQISWNDIFSVSYKGISLTLLTF